MNDSVVVVVVSMMKIKGNGVALYTTSLLHIINDTHYPRLRLKLNWDYVTDVWIKIKKENEMSLAHAPTTTLASIICHQMH